MKQTLLLAVAALVLLFAASPAAATDHVPSSALFDVELADAGNQSDDVEADATTAEADEALPATGSTTAYLVLASIAFLAAGALMLVERSRLRQH